MDPMSMITKIDATVRGGRSLIRWWFGPCALVCGLLCPGLVDGQQNPEPANIVAPAAPSPMVEGEMFSTEESGFEPFGDEWIDCNPGCAPGWQIQADWVFLNREGDRGTAMSTSYLVNDFGYDEAMRVSVAHRYDCLVGWELAYMGPFEWTQRGQVAGAGLNSLLVAAGTNLSTFSNATSLQQTYTSKLQSFEANQKWWGWDVISTIAGLRYINVEEDFAFNTVSPLGAGALNIATNNHLIGGQVGADLIYNVGRLGTTTRLRGGMYANVMDNSTILTNAGVLQVNTADDTVDFAALLELGYYFSYRVTRNISVRCGYEVSWLYGLALAHSQLDNPVSAFSGSTVDRDGDVFYHGGTVGVEVAW